MLTTLQIDLPALPRLTTTHYVFYHNRQLITIPNASQVPILPRRLHTQQIPSFRDGSGESVHWYVLYNTNSLPPRLPARPYHLKAALMLRVVHLCLLYLACIPTMLSPITPRTRIGGSHYAAFPDRQGPEGAPI